MKRFFKEVYLTGHGKEDKNIFDTFKDTKFYKVIDVSTAEEVFNLAEEVEELKDCNNVKYITFDEIKI
jgi:hypothetical protein